MGMPSSSHTTAAPPASDAVTGSRSIRVVRTGSLLRKLKPRSPLASRPTYRPYCWYQGLSRP